MFVGSLIGDKGDYISEQERQEAIVGPLLLFGYTAQKPHLPRARVNVPHSQSRS
jgi:hypothetical protein